VFWRGELLAGCLDKNQFGKFGLVHAMQVRRRVWLLCCFVLRGRWLVGLLGVVPFSLGHRCRRLHALLYILPTLNPNHHPQMKIPNHN